MERSYFYNSKITPERPPITQLEHIRSKTKIPTIHLATNFAKSERKSLKKAVTLAMKDALVKEVERKLVAKRESCVIRRSWKQFNHGQKRSFEMRNETD